MKIQKCLFVSYSKTTKYCALEVTGFGLLLWTKLATGKKEVKKVLTILKIQNVIQVCQYTRNTEWWNHWKGFKVNHVFHYVFHIHYPYRCNKKTNNICVYLSDICYCNKLIRFFYFLIKFISQFTYNISHTVTRHTYTES